VQCIAGLYGAARDGWIARAKVVLMLRNAHNYRTFEIVRAAYLMSNAKAIVSEWDEETEIEPDVAPGIALAARSELAPVLTQLLGDAEQRQALGQRALQLIMARRQSDLMRPAIEALPPGVFAN
jgi:superfamily II helicase